jgi:RsiW-degrading membrane proteinase PrsW (M82 family)
MGLRDPTEFAADEDRDLHGIATWEPRSLLDRFLAHYLSPLLRAAIVLLGLVFFLGVMLLLGFQVLQNPNTLIFVVLFPLSVIPAALITGYVWYTDITREPITMLIVTYLLGVVLASFPYLINTLTSVAMNAVAGQLPPAIAGNPVLAFLAQAGQFYFVVAPVEEVAKLAAVFMFVYWRTDFDFVIDGVVYGTMAGLGFATIENISYIIQTIASVDSLLGVFIVGGVITTVRGFAGPGHVIWTGIAGYFLGLAKFNREYAVVLAIKGLLIASFLHGTYNTLSSGIGIVFNGFGTVGGLLGLVVTFGFIGVYHLTFFGYLFWKIRNYRKVYAEVSPGDHEADVSRIDGYEEMRHSVGVEEGESASESEFVEDGPEDQGKE